MSNCKYRTMQKFIVDEHCVEDLPVCKLMSEDDEHTIFYKDAIIDDEFCSMCHMNSNKRNGVNHVK